MKQYKATTPIHTVSKIRKILSNIGILLLERHMIHDKFSSCRVVIGNDGLGKLNIGTNGKGRTFEYSLASGYAEFMERLENHLLLNSKKMLTDKTFNIFEVAKKEEKKSGFLYDQREKNVPFSDISKTFMEEIIRMCGFNSVNELNANIAQNASKTKPLVIPFYDVKNKTVIEIPIEFSLLLTGSNGMASGNTPKEAILQALCEIFERYVISEIYWNEYTPPTIPLSFFAETEIGKILSLYQKETGNKVIVKDCSLNKGIPAIGLIIINENEQLYNFKIGVDFVPAVALERCFTEIHQGRNSFEGLPFEFVKTKGVDAAEKKFVERNLIKIFINDSGFWPISVLHGEESYRFKEFNHLLGESNAYDLKYSLDLIEKMGYHVYIRNNSFLGFPAYYVVVPGMSQIIKTNPFVSIYKSSFVNFSLINKLGSVTVEIARKVFTAIDENYEVLKEEDFALNRVFVFNTNEDLRDLSIEMLAALLALYLKDDMNAIKYLALYLNGKDKKKYSYFYACLDYLKLKNSSAFPDDVLSVLYGHKMMTEVVGDLDDRNAIFQYYKFPNCPNCEKCKLKQECKHEAIMQLNDCVNRNSALLDQQEVQFDIENNKE